MRDFVETLINGNDLEEEQIRLASDWLLCASVPDDSKADFLKALRRKGESADEIAYFAEAFLEHAIDPKLDRSELSGPTLDIVGTGGDELNLFNVSTTSMFVAAGAGALVTKHGNRGVSSKSGAADVLEKLGIGLDMDPETFRCCLQSCGIGFLFAPTYHPSFKAVSSVRQKLKLEGVSSIFNLLGPLMNPVKPDFQLLGVSRHEWVHRFATISQKLGRQRVWVVCGETENGQSLDELSTMGKTQVCEAVVNGQVIEYSIEPEEYGLVRSKLGQLVGGSPAENAETLKRILNGEELGARLDLVILNAGAALTVCNIAGDLAEGIERARESILSGKALQKLVILQKFCQQL